MKVLSKGQYFGISKKRSQFKGLTITETDYPNPVSVPWHYHENAHFTFFLKGHVLETSKKDSFYATPGSLIFSNCQEPHRDSEHSANMRYFHVEIDRPWFAKHEITSGLYEGHRFFDHERYRRLFYNIYRDFREGDAVSPLAIEGSLLQCFCEMNRFREKVVGETPVWINHLRDFIRDNCSEPVSLERLAAECGRSTVYLS